MVINFFLLLLSVFSLNIVQVSAVDVINLPNKEILEKETSVTKSGTKHLMPIKFLKDHKFAFGVGLLALTICLSVAYWNTPAKCKKSVIYKKKNTYDKSMQAKIMYNTSNKWEDVVLDVDFFNNVGSVPVNITTDKNCSGLVLPTDMPDMVVYDAPSGLGIICTSGIYTQDASMGTSSNVWLKLNGTLGTFITMLRPFGGKEIKYENFKFTTVAIDIALAALIIDIGYNLITNRPELVERLYKKAFLQWTQDLRITESLE